MATQRTYPLPNTPWAASRAKAMEEAFGKAAGVLHHLSAFAAKDQAPQIHVWVWPDRAGPGKSLLMTEGLSDVELHKSNGARAGYRLELLTVSGAEPTWAANALRTVARSFVKLYGCLYMAQGHTMSLSNPVAPLAKGSKLTRFVFLQPPSMLLDQADRLLKLRIEDNPLLPLWCAGIAEEEIPLLTRWGQEEFARRLERQALVFDPMRPLLRE
jgi:hypothetical protein